MQGRDVAFWVACQNMNVEQRRIFRFKDTVSAKNILNVARHSKTQKNCGRTFLLSDRRIQ